MASLIAENHAYLLSGNTLALLTLVNVAGGYLNQRLNYGLQLNDVLWATPGHIFFFFLFWLTSLPKTRVDNALRLPLLRAVFW